MFWIRYQDADGRERKEKAGSFRAAENLVGKRRQQAREGVKLPENPSVPCCDLRGYSLSIA